MIARWHSNSIYPHVPSTTEKAERKKVRERAVESRRKLVRGEGKGHIKLTGRITFWWLLFPYFLCVCVCVCVCVCGTAIRIVLRELATCKAVWISIFGPGYTCTGPEYIEQTSVGWWRCLSTRRQHQVEETSTNHFDTYAERPFPLSPPKCCQCNRRTNSFGSHSVSVICPWNIKGHIGSPSLHGPGEAGVMMTRR